MNLRCVAVDHVGGYLRGQGVAVDTRLGGEDFTTRSVEHFMIV